MSIELTHLSAIEYDSILYGKMTPAMAAAYLMDGQIVLRTFGETLERMYSGKDLLPRLVDAFLSEDPGANPQSVARKIRNWLSGRNQPARREDIFRIAFALGLGESQLNYLLGLCTDYGIQYRNSYDVIFAWFLRNRRGYSEAERFFAKLPPAKELNELPGDVTSSLTHHLQNEFLFVQNTEELFDCYMRNIDRFGSLHLRAYYYFEKYLNQLIHPAPSWDGEQEADDYSVETVMNIYLSLQMPSGKKRKDYSLIQKLLKQNWPNATSIKNIRSHNEDVPRKLLLLLYVVTENVGVLSGQYEESDEEYMTLQDRVEDHWWMLNAMLGDCGMAPIDPRNAMDWLVLYSICADENEPMSERMESVISCMFENLT